MRNNPITDPSPINLRVVNHVPLSYCIQKSAIEVVSALLNLGVDLVSLVSTRRVVAVVAAVDEEAIELPRTGYLTDCTFTIFF